MVTTLSKKFLREQINKLKSDKDYFQKRIGDIDSQINILRDQKNLMQSQIDDTDINISELQLDVNS